MLSKLGRKILFKLTSRGGYFFIKSGGAFIQRLLNLFLLKYPDEKEKNFSFEKQMKKYQLSEDDLQKRHHVLIQHSLFYLILGLFAFSYGCYFLSYRVWYPFSLCWAVSLLLFTLSFRAHFWSYQIKIKKLGCRFSEWALFVLKG